MRHGGCRESGIGRSTLGSERIFCGDPGKTRRPVRARLCQALRPCREDRGDATRKRSRPTGRFHPTPRRAARRFPRAQSSREGDPFRPLGTPAPRPGGGAPPPVERLDRLRHAARGAPFLWRAAGGGRQRAGPDARGLPPGPGAGDPSAGRARERRGQAGLPDRRLPPRAPHRPRGHGGRVGGRGGRGRAARRAQADPRRTDHPPQPPLLRARGPDRPPAGPPGDRRRPLGRPGG